MTSLYYDPAHFGYECVAMLDEDGLSYEFHMLGVWKRISDGRLFWAEDSGCSCPSPFEDCEDPSGSDWPEPLDKTRAEFEDRLREFPATPTEKHRFWILARKPFGVNVVVSSDGATRV